MSNALRRYEFSERLADILGESRRDLRVRVTLLISGGLIPPGPRGPGAPPATADYAADLLIGVMAAPLQVHTVDAVRCYRALVPTRLAAGDGTPGIVLRRGNRPRLARRSADPTAVARPPFGEAVARLLALAHAEVTRALVARDVFGLWLARGFPVAAIQLATWTDDGRSIISQRYELPPDARPPAWLDPERGGSADPGLAHSVLLPVDKLIQIGALITPSDDKRMPPVIDLGQKIASLANLARLARETRHRRPWQSFLAAAAAAEDTAARIDMRDEGLAEVFDFGGNPGDLRMLTYVPNDLPTGAAALVVVLHGCTQTAASYDRGTGWSTLAARHGFALLLPEQRRANNPLRCFNWFRAEDHVRDSGEALSIRQMVDRMIADHGIDPKRVYVTGLSAGGAMTSVLLATYPDVFAGGAILSAVPYKAAVGLQDAFDAIFQGKTLPAEDWAARVRAASPHAGPWPRVQVWHGEADATVKPINQAEIVKQWTAVHGLPAAPNVEKRVDGHLHRIWRDAEGRDLIEAYTVAGMAHGAAIDPSGPDGVGQPQPFIIDAGISSTWQIARSWGLTASRRDARPATADQPTSRPHPRPRSDEPAPVIFLPPAAANATGDSPRARTVEPDEIVPPSAQQGDDAHREKARGAGADDAWADAGESTVGIDVSAIIKRSFELAGLIEPAPAGAARASTAPLGLDIPGIIATSLEAAGLFKRARAEGSPHGTPPPNAGPQPAEKTPPPADPAEARKREPETVIPDRIDLQTILTRSFEASGLLRTVAAEAPTDTPTADAPTADTAGSDSGGWRLLTGDAEASEPAVLFGRVSSGTEGTLGARTKSIDCRIDLGNHPRLSYARRLDLRAALNPFTTAAFTVLVDGEPVDEAAASGMDYAEDEWTRRADIDLGRFAGRTVTLTFTLEANSNLYKEVSAEAWVREIVIDEAPRVSAGIADEGSGESEDELLAPI